MYRLHEMKKRKRHGKIVSPIKFLHLSSQILIILIIKNDEISPVGRHFA